MITPEKSLGAYGNDLYTTVSGGLYVCLLTI